MRFFRGTVFSMAVYNVGREKLYLSTIHRIWILFSSSLCRSRFLSLAATQTLSRYITTAISFDMGTLVGFMRKGKSMVTGGE